MKRRGAAVLCALCIGASVAADEPATGWHERSIDVDGRTRWYRTYRPAAARDGAPGVLLLHGGTQSMRKIFRDSAGGTRAWLAIAERDGVVLIVPNGTHRGGSDTAGDNQTWNDLRPGLDASPVDDVAFLRALVETQTRELGLDPKRVYVTGASNGGMMTYRLLIEAPERFAAGAAFIANLPAGPSALPRPARPTPLFIFNGTLDPLVKWDGGTVGRDRGEVASTRETVAWWIAANGARDTVARQETLPDADPTDGCRISLEVHDAGPLGAPVWFYTAIGGGHAMPSIRHEIPDSPLVRRYIGPVCRDAEGAELAWQFFRLQSLPGAR